MYFLPEWYLENERVRKRKVLKIFISTIIIIDLILAEILFVNINKKKLLDKEINQKIMQQKNDAKQIEKIKDKSNKTLDTFLTFIKNAQENFNFESLYIEERKIEMNFDSKKLDYKLLVKNIEMNNDFIVKQIVFPSNEDTGKIKIYMELK